MTKCISILISLLLVLTLIPTVYAQCSGTFDCSIIDDEYICSNVGCGWTPGSGSCTGTPTQTDCTLAPDQNACEFVGCAWDATAASCSGTVAGCDIAVDKHVCGEIGCTWAETGAACSGTGSCESAPDEGSCVAASGCTWTEEVPEGHFDCNQLETDADKNDCWFGTAMNSRDVGYCEEITDETMKGECKDALVEHGERTDEKIEGVEIQDGKIIGSDSDNDGVLDENDQCPDTPANTPVDETGCKDESPPTVEECVEWVNAEPRVDEDGRSIGPDDCYMYYAFENKDSSYCDSITDEGMKNNCKEAVGGGFKRDFEQKKEDFADECPVKGMPHSIEDCQALASAQCKGPGGEGMSAEEIDHCIHHVAWDQDNIELCDRISDANIKTDCIKSLGGDMEMKEKQRRRTKGPEGGMPVEIPKEILEAGAGQDFINMFCKTIKSGIDQQLKSSMEAIIGHFTDMNADTRFSGVFNIDVSPIQAMVAEVTTLIAGVCASTPDTFKEAVLPLKALLEEGGDSIGVVVEAAFGQMDNQFRAYMKTLQADMEAEMLALQGQMEANMQTWQQDAQAAATAAGYDPQTDQAGFQAYIEDYMRTKSEEFMKAGMESAGQMGEVGEYFGGLMEEFDQKMKSQWKEEETAMVASIKEQFADMKILFNKVMTYHLAQAEARRDELIAEGLDTTAFDAAITAVEAKMTEVEGLFDQAISNMDNVNMDDDDESNDIWELQAAGQSLIDTGIDELMTLWHTKEEEVEAAMRTQMQKKLVDKFFARLDEFKTLYETKLAEAKAEGLDTTKIESLYADILDKETKARTAYDAENYDEALMYLGLIKAKYELMEKEHKNVKTVAVINDFLGKATALQNKLASAKKRAEMFEARGMIDATNLKTLIDEFDALITSATTKKNAGDSEGALADLQAAKLKWEAINAEWTSLAAGAGG